MVRLTPVVQNLLFINIIVFVAQNIAEPLTGLLSLYSFRYEEFRPYQLFTYMFCHAGIGHLFFNMLTLIFFGPILEEVWGQRRFVIFYTICGVGAGIFSILMDLFGFGMFGIMIGASGAVYGVLTAFGITFPNMQLSLLFLPFSFKAKYLVMVFGAIAIYSGFRSTPGDNVAHFAHLGGIVVAILWIQFSRFR